MVVKSHLRKVILNQLASELDLTKRFHRVLLSQVQYLSHLSNVHLGMVSQHVSGLGVQSRDQTLSQHGHLQ